MVPEAAHSDQNNGFFLALVNHRFEYIYMVHVTSNLFFSTDLPHI